MINPLRYLSIRARIGGSIGIVVLLITVFQLIYFPSQQFALLQRALQHKALSLANGIAYQVAVNETLNSELVKQVFRGAARDNDFVYAGLYQPDGRLFEEYHLGRRKQLPQLLRRKIKEASFEISSRLVQVTVPVAIKDQAAGALIMGFSTKSIEKQRSNIQVATWGASLIILMLGLVVALIVSSRLTRPILRMTQAFRRMADGDLRQPQILVDTQDETGELTKAFNELLATLLQLGQTAKVVSQGNLGVTIDVKGDLADAFRDMLKMLRELSEKSKEISEGNLGLVLTAKGDLADAFRQMIASQRGMVKQIAETALQLTAAATQYQSNARHQESGAVQQSAAVEENRRTLDNLVDSARQIASKAQDVLENAEKTQRNSQLVSERITILIKQTRRITEILEVIKEIADKSDMLALNAALEGTKAGDAGRGFSLVAIQMQNLAEDVMESVKRIEELTDSITNATQATVQATEESQRLTGDATQSARQIVAIIKQQQVNTEQVTRAMDGVAKIARESAADSKQFADSTKSLVFLSDRLQSLVGQFRHW